MNFHLRLRQGAPGDTLACSGLVHDLTVAGHGVAVTGTRADEVFANWNLPTPTVDFVDVPIDYKPTVDASVRDKTRRYCTAAHDAFEAATGISGYRRTLRPRLVLSGVESTPPRPTPYAVVAGGSKSDIPLKQTPPELFAAVVAMTNDLNWLQLGKVDGGRIRQRQWAIPGATNLLGVTDLRGLFRYVAHASVVLCHTSLPLLAASALGVPCVVVGGGREDPWLFDDLGVTYLHAIGKLDCCKEFGCRAVFPRAAHIETPYPRGLVCADPVVGPTTTVGRCMTLLSPAEISAAVRAVARA